jgi:Tfp pilus assembly protein PilE
MRRLRRLAEDPGQGVYEMVAMIAFIAVVLAVATPAYLRFQSRKADKAAQEALVAGTKGAESYRWAHGSFARMSNVDLVRETRGLSTPITVAWAHEGRYCLAASAGGNTWSLRGPYTGEPKFRRSGNCS